MSRPNPVALAIAAMALASVSEHLRDGQSAADLTPEERLAREREHDRQRAQEAWWRADRLAQRRAQADAAAAPYREERRRRNAAKLATGQWQPPAVSAVPASPA